MSFNPLPSIPPNQLYTDLYLQSPLPTPTNPFTATFPSQQMVVPSYILPYSVAMIPHNPSPLPYNPYSPYRPSPQPQLNLERRQGRGPWTRKETEALYEALLKEKCGDINWDRVSKDFPTRQKHNIMKKWEDLQKKKLFTVDDYDNWCSEIRKKQVERQRNSPLPRHPFLFLPLPPMPMLIPLVEQPPEANGVETQK